MKYITLYVAYVALQLTLFPLHAAESVLTDAVELDMTEVVFEEVEPGLEPYLSRLLLSQRFLRLDGGDDQGGFVLFNRETHEIHSFNHEDGSHLLMKPLKVQKLEFELNFKVEKEQMADAPKIQGEAAVQHLFYADSRLCKKSFNITGLLPEITQVLIDYEQAIVEQNKRSFAQIPASVRSSCYMANNYLHASEYLRVGFPLFVVDDQQRQKRLVSFGQVTRPRSILEIPEGYRLYHPNASNLD